MRQIQKFEMSDPSQFLDLWEKELEESKTQAARIAKMWVFIFKLNFSIQTLRESTRRAFWVSILVSILVMDPHMVVVIEGRFLSFSIELL